MKLLLLNARLRDIVAQRNSLLLICVSLLLIVFVQALYTLFKSEHVVIVPPEITQSFWVEKGRVSANYIEEMALFFATLILDNSAGSCAYQRDVLLRYAVPEAYGRLRAMLLEDEERFKKEQLSTSFKPASIQVNPKTLIAEITGDLISYVGQKRLSQVRESYRFAFTYKQGRLLIQSFEAIRSQKHG
ncbi:MAG: type IV conjugative transfer system protein TraE [Alphaproteobacteria bacterium]|nr:type IV conjugative transfer system protein TraE [Alphaproteobacteria bacterium]